MTDPELATRSVPAVEAGGARIPALGLGTWHLEGAEAERTVERALEIGYRHIDTAQVYGNEEAIGRALERSNLPRDELFLTTKVWPDSYRDIPGSMRKSRERLRLEAVDLLLLHWPHFTEVSLEEAVEALSSVREEGAARHVGVSNFTVHLLKRTKEVSEAPLVTNQIEYHPFLDQSAALRAARELSVSVTAYCPLAQGRVVRDPTLREIGQRHGKTPAQVALRWLVRQEGVAAIPRTGDPEHLAANLDIFDFELTDEEARQVGGLARPDGRIIDPEGLAPVWD